MNVLGFKVELPQPADLMNWHDMWPVRPSAPVTIGLGIISSVFFGVLLGYSIYRNQRDYVRGLALIVAGSLSELIRGLFGSHLSPHPATAGGLWRLANGTLMIIGFAIYYRAWSRLRKRSTSGGQR